MRKWGSLLVVLILGLLFHPLAAEDGGKLTILFSGFVQGNYGPCGCQNAPAGGFSRRSGYAQQHREKSGSAILHVDLGHLLLPRGPDASKVNPAMIDAMESLPISVVNLAAGDLHEWEALSAIEGPRIISSNLEPKTAATPRPSPYAIVTVPGSETGLSRDLKIGFLGVTNPARVPPRSKFRASDPVEAIARLAEQAAAEADFLVVLSDLDRPRGPLREDSQLARLASAHPKVYAVLNSERLFIHRPAEQVQNAIILSSVERGRHLGQLELRLDSSGNVVEYESDYVDLVEGVPEDPHYLAIQQRLAPFLPGTLQTPH